MTEIFFKQEHSPYFQTSSQTVFSTALLEQVTQQLVHASVTFESQADVYNATFGVTDAHRLAAYEEKFSRVRNPQSSSSWKLNNKRLEDGWFLYQLVSFFDEHDKLSSQNLYTVPDCSNRRNIEELCQLAVHHISTMSPRWVHHQCSVKGCKEGFAVIDGNEKIKRAMCAAPKSRVFVDDQKIYMTQCCSRSPVSGGKSLQGSKYCHHHSFLESCEDSAVVATTNLPSPHASNPLLEKSKVGSLPENDSSELLVGCKKSQLNKFYDKTAGILSLVRPCGIIINTAEMYTCESPTQAYIFLIMTFARGRDIDRIRYIGYDRACDLHPFLLNLSRQGAYFARWLIRHVTFMVDSFHIRNHVESCCMPPENPNCQYHPTLPKFSEIHGVNTECAEQSFRWLNRFKYSMRNMHQYTFNFFLHVIINKRNNYRELQLKEKSLM